MKLVLVLPDGMQRDIEMESPEEAVATFRGKVGSLFSINESRVQLAFRGQILHDNETLAMYDLNEGSHISCVLIPEPSTAALVQTISEASENESHAATETSSVLTPQISEGDNDSLTLKIKVLNGTDKELKVNRTESVETFRRQVGALIGMEDIGRIRLIHMGRVIEDGDILSAYSLSNGAWIHCALRPEGAAPSQASTRRPSDTSLVSQTSGAQTASTLGIASQMNVQSLGNGMMTGSISIDANDLELLSASGMDLETIVNQMLISQGIRPAATTISAVSTAPVIRSSDSQGSGAESGPGSGSGSGSAPRSGAQRRPSLVASTGDGVTGTQAAFQRFRDYPLQTEPSVLMRNPLPTQQNDYFQQQERSQNIRALRNALTRRDTIMQPDIVGPQGNQSSFSAIPSVLQSPMLRQDSSFSALESTAGSRPQSYNFSQFNLSQMSPEQRQQFLAAQQASGAQLGTSAQSVQDIVQESNRRRQQVEAARRASMDSASVASRASRDSRASVYRLSTADRRFQGAVETGLGSARQLAASLQQMSGTRAVLSNINEVQVPSQAMGSMLWDLSVCLNGLQVPVATMSQRMSTNSFFADAPTMDGRVERLSEISRMRAVLSNLADVANRASEALGYLGMEVQATLPVPQMGAVPDPTHGGVAGPVRTTAVYSNPSSVAGMPPLVPVFPAPVRNGSGGTSLSGSQSQPPPDPIQLPPTDDPQRETLGLSTPVAQQVLSSRRVLSQSQRSEAEESEVFEEEAFPADETLDDDVISPRDPPAESVRENVDRELAREPVPATSSGSDRVVSPQVPAATVSSPVNLTADRSVITNPSPLLQNQPVPLSDNTLSLPIHGPSIQPTTSSTQTPGQPPSRSASDSRNPWRIFRTTGK